MPATPAATRLSLRGVTKRYGSVTALAPLTMDLPAGAIHGILGENGAGKSTLVRIIAGAVRPDGGTVAIDGATLPLGDPRAARSAGVGVVHQHFALVGALTVAENLALGRPEASGRWLRPQRLADEARGLAERYGFEIGDPSLRCEALPVGLQARIEILRALAGEPRVLLLDEPTAVLTPPEIDELFATLRGLRAAGLLILFVTHKLAEALALCDAVSVLRGGKLVGTAAAKDVTADELARRMVGADLAAVGGAKPSGQRKAGPAAEALALVARDLATAPARGRIALDGVGLTVAAGEICGIAGVDGNGQDELAAALAGLAPRRGIVVVHGHTVAPNDVHAAQDAGIAFIPGDRRREGLAPSMAVWENALLAAPLLARFTRFGGLDVGRAHAFAAALVHEYRVTTAGLDHPIAALSGGNQQRIVIARTLAQAPRVTIAVNPTRGLDLAATAAVHALLAASAAAGAAVLLLSTDLDELARTCDRLLVIYRGRLLGPVAPSDRARVGALMAGLS